MAEDLPDLFFLLAGAVSAALVFTIYHVSTWCNRYITSTATPAGPQQLEQPLAYEDGATPAGCVEVTPVHKYGKDMGLVGDDGMCVVCLSEFEEDEELRTLPHCMHSFHVPCIDMWLRSHMNCPLCRSPLSVMFSETRQDLQISPTNNIAAQPPSV